MKIRNGYDLRQQVLDALNSTYAPDCEGQDWYALKFVKNNYAVELNMQLTTDILAAFAFYHVDDQANHRMMYYGESPYREILNIIWTAWPGGTTAESCARKVCKVLNVTVEE